MHLTGPQLAACIIIALLVFGLLSSLGNND